MKKILLLLSLTPFFTSAQKITITVVLNGTPEWTTKLVPTNLKYNKWGRLGLTVDDRQSSGLNLFAYITGGLAPQNKTIYSGLTFTDGTNVRTKNIKWTGSFATNAWISADSSVDGAMSNGLSWPQMKILVDSNWSILDHGAFHGTDLPGAVKLGFNPLMNAAANRNYTFRKLAALGSEYVMRFGVVPSADAGYHAAWEQLGYLGGSSQNVDDGYPNTVPDWMNYGLVNVTNWKNDNRYKVHLRRFRDLTKAGGPVSDFLDGALALIAQSKQDYNLSYEYGMHNADIDSVQKAMNAIWQKANDHIWICGMQEFYEYFQTIQQTAITQKLSGDTLTVTLDQSFLPEDLRWRDMSFVLNSNAVIKNISVTGADDYSYNTSTGLINIYKKKTKGFVIPPGYSKTRFVFNQKIPLTIKNFFLDNNYDNKPTALIDGDVTTQFHAKNYDAPMIYAPSDLSVDLSDYGAVVNKVNIYCGSNTGYTTQVILTRNDNEQEVVIGSFNGSKPNQWLTFTTDPKKKFVASRLILRSTTSNGFGNELQVYADYLPYKEQTYQHHHTPLGDMLGTNAHWWNFVRNAVSESSAIVWSKMWAFDSLHLHSLRNYGNADNYTDQYGSQYAFNPVVQGWFEDDFMWELKKKNPNLVRWSVLFGQTKPVAATWNVPDVNWAMKGVVSGYVIHAPTWGTLTVSIFSAKGSGMMRHTYVDAVSGKGISQTSNDWNDIPKNFPAKRSFNISGDAKYRVGDTVVIRGRHTSQFNYLYTNNNNAGRSTPATWDSVARLAYVWAARKGTNKNATRFNPYRPDLGWLENNDSRVGLGTSEWTEIMNEPDAWWAGYDDYLNGQHLAVAWSKIYDNNKVFSASLGAKNADPNMMVSTSGLAVNNIDAVRSVDFWTKKNRGSRPKTNVPAQTNSWRAKTFGWSDNPYDVIQFHNYSYTGGSNQFAGGLQAGLPPELSNVLNAVDDFVWFRNKYAPWAKVDVGEWGYDVNQNSNMNAPPIANYNAEQVRGYWAIRTLIEYNVHGVDLSQWYRLYQDSEADSSNSTQFATMSLLKENADGTVTRRIVGNHFAQLSEFGNYVFDSTLREDSIRVYRFKNGANYLYAIWSVEKVKSLPKQKPQFTNRAGIYKLPISNGTLITIRTLQDKGLVMASSSATVEENNYPVHYDLKPLFILVHNKKQN